VAEVTVTERKLTSSPNRPSRAADCSGGALIEFAFCLPLLLVLIAGILDFGFLFRDYQVLVNAARDGARMAVLPDNYTVEDVQARVTAYLEAGGVTEMPIEPPLVEPDCFIGSVASFRTRRVTVRLPHTFTYLGPIGSLISPGLGVVTLEATSEMRIEAPSAGGCS
jgi:hypothetical protein